MCAAIIPRVSKIRSFTKRATSHLFDLTLDKLVATALRAKFDEYELIGNNGKFDRSMIIKMLARKYFFGILVVVFRSLPSDVVRYIGNFFDFDVSFQPRVQACMDDRIFECNYRIDEYRELIDRRVLHYQHGEDYAPGELPSELLQRAAFDHMISHPVLSHAYYQLVLEREREQHEWWRLKNEEASELENRLGLQARRQFLATHSPHFLELKNKHKKKISEFCESIVRSEDFAHALLQITTNPEYVQCRVIVARNPNAEILPRHW